MRSAVQHGLHTIWARRRQARNLGLVPGESADDFTGSTARRTVLTDYNDAACILRTVALHCTVPMSGTVRYWSNHNTRKLARANQASSSFRFPETGLPRHGAGCLS